MIRRATRIHCFTCETADEGERWEWNSANKCDLTPADYIATMLTACSFQYIIRLLNTNVDGKQKVMYAMTRIKGVGRRYSNLVCKKADVDLSKRAGDLTSEELERIVTILQNPLQCTFDITKTWWTSIDCPQTRFPPGSLTGSAILSMARTLKSSPTVSIASSVRILSA